MGELQQAATSAADAVARASARCAGAQIVSP